GLDGGAASGSDASDDSAKWKNLRGLDISDYADKDRLFDVMDAKTVEAVIHLGANTDTTERDARQIMDENFEYSKKLWLYCVKHNIRFIYASSASVYGDGALGYRETIPPEKLTPLNAYAYSKLLFDRWAVRRSECPPLWAGLRFFNVYGPGEAHKNHMASMVFHAFHQIRKNGVVRLFKSYDPNYSDGEQKRDFVYVGDVADICLFFLDRDAFPSGFYYVGTGHAQSFNELVNALFASLSLGSSVEYIEMPATLIRQYQYFTEADIGRLRQIGYERPIRTIQDGVAEYARYLLRNE
ncbi:MAG: ADP-glyceromanno-heptose 6-epimerase, partial [Cohnella sp.]|nr:ADP-glyceromanno-heptose 6-epimerase [Cohnella sp.]